MASRNPGGNRHGHRPGSNIGAFLEHYGGAFKLVAAIGAGAAVVPHANDSGFWVVTRLTGIDIKPGYRLYTVGAAIVGAFAAILVFLASLFVA